MLRRSDTGHFILIEPTTGATVVDEELVRAYERMEALLSEHELAPRAAAPSAFEFRGRARLWAIAAALALPLLWLWATQRPADTGSQVHEPVTGAPTVNRGQAPPATKPEAAPQARLADVAVRSDAPTNENQAQASAKDPDAADDDDDESPARDQG